MSAVKCVALHPVSLPDGRLLPPGRRAERIDLDHPEVRAAVDDGRLVEIEEIPTATASTSPPDASGDPKPPKRGRRRPTTSTEE